VTDVLQDRRLFVISHGYSSGSRSSSAVSVLQINAAICVMALVEFSRPHNSHKVSLLSKHTVYGSGSL